MILLTTNHFVVYFNINLNSFIYEKKVFFCSSHGSDASQLF